VLDVSLALRLEGLAACQTRDLAAKKRERQWAITFAVRAAFLVTYMLAVLDRTLADLASATIMETKMAEDVSSTIAALEDERYAAMLAGDAGTLDHLLDDRLRHVHSSGQVDNKASWMSNFGRLWQYQSIERKDQTIVPLGDSALVFNTLNIDVQVADVLRKVDARALTVWNKSSGAWRVVAVFLATISIAQS